MKRILLVAVTLCLPLSVPSFAYEPGTHQTLADRATRQSVLATNDGVLSDLGLKGYRDSDQVFPDPQHGGSIYLGPNNTHPYSPPDSADILDLIKAGAALEDEFPRSLFHFYDPVPGHLDPLNINGVTVPYSAPDWAIEDSFLPVVGQSYSLKDADEYFRKALTSVKQDDRNLAFGSLFLSLGHAIHLLQDAAQPQHVRNDMHCDSDVCKDAESALKSIFGKDVPLYNPSMYESDTYNKANVAGYGGYSVGNLPVARDYWVSQDNKGLAQFTNENFVSAGTNFHLDNQGYILSNSQYLLPTPDSLSDYVTVDEVYQELGKAAAPDQIHDYCAKYAASHCSVNFVGTSVIDSYTGTSEVNERAATYSVWDSDLEHYKSEKLFSLNALNFQYDWKYLLPRAIGYSAGLINYFFRGRLDVQPDPNTPGGYLVINKSSDPMSNGTLALYYDDKDGSRHLVQNWTNVSMSAAGHDPADQYPITFTAPTDPAPAKPGEYMLVFQGKIGSEEGIAGKQIEIQSNPLFYATFDRKCDINSYLGCSVVYRYTGDFSFKTFEQTDDHVNTSIDQMAVYDGNDYTADTFLLPGGAWNTVAKFNNNVVLFGFPTGSSGSTVIEGVAVNSTHAYVASLDRPSWVENIHVYDHDGNFQSILPDVPMQALSSFAANDDHFCLSGWDHRGFYSATILTDLSGSVLARWPGDPDLGGGPCTLTRDRAYILTWTDQDQDAMLTVADMYGGQIASLDIAGTDIVYDDDYFPYSVSATDSRVYLRAYCWGCTPGQIIIIYDRVLTRDDKGNITSERFVREQPDMVAPSQTWDAYLDVVMDMKDVLGTPKQ